MSTESMKGFRILSSEMCLPCIPRDNSQINELKESLRQLRMEAGGTSIRNEAGPEPVLKPDSVMRYLNKTLSYCRVHREELLDMLREENVIQCFSANYR